MTPGAKSAHDEDKSRAKGKGRTQHFQGWWRVPTGQGWRRKASTSRQRGKYSCLPTNAGEGVGPFDPKTDTTTMQNDENGHDNNANDEREVDCHFQGWQQHQQQ